MCLLNCEGSGCYGVTCWPGSIGCFCRWFSVLRSITVVVIVAVCVIFPSSSLVFLFGMVVEVVRCSGFRNPRQLLRMCIAHADRGLLVFI